VLKAHKVMSVLKELKEDKDFKEHKGQLELKEP
jgi:hypothetical protein